jgi:hypothetical protein
LRCGLVRFALVPIRVDRYRAGGSRRKSPSLTGIHGWVIVKRWPSKHLISDFTLRKR